MTANPNSPAFQTTVTAGYRLLSGEDALATQLPPPTAVFALEHLREVLPEWTADVRRRRDEPAAEDRAFHWLQVRTDVWAVMEVVRRTEEELSDRGDPAVANVSAAYDALWEPFDEFDAALEACKPILAAVSQSKRLQALREMLSAEYRVPLPWWLDPDSFRDGCADEPVIR